MIHGSTWCLDIILHDKIQIDFEAEFEKWQKSQKPEKILKPGYNEEFQHIKKCYDFRLASGPSPAVAAAHAREYLRWERMMIQND